MKPSISKILALNCLKLETRLNFEGNVNETQNLSIKVFSRQRFYYNLVGMLISFCHRFKRSGIKFMAALGLFYLTKEVLEYRKESQELNKH